MKIIKKTAIFYLLVTLGFLLLGEALIQGQEKEQTQQEKYVFRVRVEERLLDALVVDKKGNPVSGLTKEDFQLLIDGKEYPIESVQEIKIPEQFRDIKAKKVILKDISIPSETSKLQHRHFIIIIGAGMMNHREIRRAQKDISKFIDSQLLPTDRVVIALVGRTVRAITGFTSDKERLVQSLEILTDPKKTKESELVDFRGTNPFLEVQELGDYRSDARAEATDSAQDEDSPDAVDLSPDVTWLKKQAGQLSRETLARIFMDNIWRIAKSLSTIPGRKVMFIFNSGFDLIPYQPPQTRISTTDWKSLTLADYQEFEMEVDPVASISKVPEFFKAIDECNKSNISIYSFNTAGLLSSLDEALLDAGGDRNIWLKKKQFYKNSWLYILANQTGGRYYQQSNTYKSALEDVNYENSLYYLVSFNPKNIASEEPQSITLTVRNPDLTVRTYRTLYKARDFSLLSDKEKEVELLKYLFSDRKVFDFKVSTRVILSPHPVEGLKLAFLMLHLQPAMFTLPPPVRYDMAIYFDDPMGKDSMLTIRYCQIDDKKQLDILAKSGLKYIIPLEISPNSNLMKLSVMNHASGEVCVVERPVSLAMTDPFNISSLMLFNPQEDVPFFQNPEEYETLKFLSKEHQDYPHPLQLHGITYVPCLKAEFKISDFLGFMFSIKDSLASKEILKPFKVVIIIKDKNDQTVFRRELIKFQAHHKGYFYQYWAAIPLKKFIPDPYRLQIVITHPDSTKTAIMEKDFRVIT